MVAAPIPSCESARLDALHRCHILDTPSEPAFDELARLAAYVCRTPMAVISLVDATRQWFKSVVGLPFTESPRSIAFCAHTILGTDLFIVGEADADERFDDHPWVVESPSIRFYAGVPLITPDGHAIGSLAVMDAVPRSLTPEQRACLNTIANQVMTQLAVRNGRKAVSMPPDDSAVHAAYDQVKERLCHSETRLREAQRLAQIGDWELDLRTNVLFWADEIYRIFEVDPATFQASYEGFLNLVHPDDREMVHRVYSDSIGQRTPYGITHRLLMQDGRIKVVHERGVTHYLPDGTPARSVGTVQDITERKQAEGALRVSQERLQQALQASNTGLWDWNTESGAVSFSKEWKSQLGYGESELSDSFETWAALLHPDDRDRAMGYAQRYRDNPVGAFRQDFRLRHKDGSYRWIDSHASFVTEADGRRIRLLGSHTDITARKQAEEALQLTKFTVDRATDAMYWVGADAKLLDVNDAACAMLGYTREEFGRMTVHDINPHFPADSWPVYWEETRRRGAASFESFHQAKDGRLIPIEVNVSFLSYQGRECHCAFVRDITGRRQVEEERARALHNLQTIMETVPDVIFALDLEGRLSRWNLRLEAVTGYAPIELSGKPALEMVPFDEAERTAAAIREAFETGYAELEGHLLTKDGRPIPYHWTGAPFTDLQGRVVGVTGVGRDMTERKQAERMLAAEKQILEMIGADTPLSDVLVALCRMIEGLSDGALCSVLLLDDEGQRLRHGAAPNLPEAYTRAINGMTIGPMRGSCGTAAFTGRQVIVEDIGRDPLWADFRSLALPHGLRACWSTPIMSAAGKVLGTFAVYYRTVRSSVGELFPVDRASHLACLAIERAQAQAALRLTRFSIERAADAVFWIDAQARILDVNDAACMMLGYAREELLSMTVPDIDPSFPAEVWPAHWEDLKARHSFSFEADHRKKDGRIIRTETTVNFLVHEGKEYNCAIVRDISDRKRTEDRLKFSEERFRLVAEATNDILWDWDLVTQEHWWSPNAHEKFGYDPNAEPSITAWMDRLHPDDRGRVLELVDRALASDARMVTAEYRFRLADGSYGYFYDRGQIVREASGQAIRMIGAMIDVTLSKRAYASLEVAYQRLQSMSRELVAVESNERRRLSRELHDEVGQLLTGLKFDLEATRQALSEKSAVAVTRAHERTRRALKTTDELFARLRRIVRALRPPVLEELGLKEALEAMVSDIRSQSDLACSVSIDADGLGALTDTTVETALYRMAQELATNAVRHGQAMTMSIILTTDSRHWILTVLDDGVGFDPQAESISGMGLRGVRERAEILGGQVDISSIPGAGSTVTVWIPIARQAPEKA